METLYALILNEMVTWEIRPVTLRHCLQSPGPGGLTSSEQAGAWSVSGSPRRPGHPFPFASSPGGAAFKSNTYALFSPVSPFLIMEWTKINKNQKQCNWISSKKTRKRNRNIYPCLNFQVPCWTTRLATISNPSPFHWNFLVKFGFLWGCDLTKNTLQVFVSIWNHWSCLSWPLLVSLGWGFGACHSV